ncbi:polymorphic toxin-type HINT domain-containing protein [Streptomyces sp. NPDC006430]|uniref:polymorphic toxin-type HINT domain-containing protein n=1 Tax=Streptomyces sp. NPDC006430 TaxID=3154299 RepID=UPI0033B36AA2
MTFSDPSGLSIAPPTMPIKDFTDAEAAWANMIQGKSALDIALEVAMGIPKDASGYNDIRDCLGGDWGACAGLALDAALPFAGRAKRIIKAPDRAWEAFNSWSQKLSLARDILRRVERYQQARAKYAEDLAEWKRQIEEAAERARKLEEEAAASKDTDSGGTETTAPACNSFVPGTKVLMADGSSKPIEDVATNPESGATAAQPVVAQIFGEGQKNLVEITIDTDGAHGDASEKLTATDGHPFWAPSLDKWLKATDLTAGQWLQTSSGTWVQVTEVKRWTQHQKVRNLTVASEHTYYVLAGSTPVLVHNCGKGDGKKVESPAFKKDPYHPKEVEERSIPQEVHDTVDAIRSGAIDQRISSGDWIPIRDAGTPPAGPPGGSARLFTQGWEKRARPPRTTP